MRRAVVVFAVAAGVAWTPAAHAATNGVDAALKGAAAPRSEIARDVTATLPGGAVVNRYEQWVKGYRVADASAVVLDPVDGAPELLFDQTVADIAPLGDPEVTSAEAMGVARRAVGLDAGSATADAEPVILTSAGERLAWEVSVVSKRPFTDYLVRVDAATGEIISKRNRIQTATGAAKLYLPNPVVENDGYAGLKDRGDRDSALLTSLRSAVTLQRLDDGQACLKGEWATVKVSPKHKQVCKASLDWSGVKRSKDNFSALMAYHHIDGAQDYIQSLGLSTGANGESQKVFANDKMPSDLGQDNSFYSPGSDEIHMGRGGVDDSEDGDVLVHEYGHAVQDAQTAAFGGGGSQTGAQSEGFGDYLAAAYSTELAGFDAEWTPCIMEWDATSYDNDTPSSPGICLRRADNDNTRVQQQALCGQDYHCLGEAWSSPLLELRQLLGSEGGDNVMDRVVLASHELVPSGPDFQEASEALIAADEALYGSGDHCTEIRDELVARLLLSPTLTC